MAIIGFRQAQAGSGNFGHDVTNISADATYMHGVKNDDK